MLSIIYYKQISSDGDHEFDSTLQNTTMTTSTSTLEIINSPGEVRTITLTDAITGVATIIPIIPKKCWKINRPTIIVTGCNFIVLL